MKKMILVAAMAIGCGIAAFGTTWKDSKGITWEFERGGTNPNYTAKITGATPVPKGALTIPATVYDDEWPCTVTEIGGYGYEFSDNSGITSVVIPAGVTKRRALSPTAARSPSPSARSRSTTRIR